MKLAFVDYLILALYFVFVIGIGWTLRKRNKSAGEFLTAGRSVPVWITSLAFLAANLGAQEVVGMAASGAKYGIMTAHFYWLGAVPAMIFVGVFMMPFYYGSKARSVPEYLNMRFDARVRDGGACFVESAYLASRPSMAAKPAVCARLRYIIRSLPSNAKQSVVIKAEIRPTAVIAVEISAERRERMR